MGAKGARLGAVLASGRSASDLLRCRPPRGGVAHSHPHPHTPAVARIALVKPEKARAIEDMIIGAARKGALKEKVSEDSLIGLLEQVNEQTQATSKISFQRRNMWDDDD